MARRLRARDRRRVRAGHGQDIRYTVLSYPDRTFTAKLNYVAAGLDPATRRLMVRATIDNPDRLLKPQMYANVSIVTATGGLAGGYRARR